MTQEVQGLRYVIIWLANSMYNQAYDSYQKNRTVPKYNIYCEQLLVVNCLQQLLIPNDEKIDLTLVLHLPDITLVKV